MRPFTDKMTQLTFAFTLALSMVMCFCRVHHFTHGFSDAVPTASVQTCCPKCENEAPDEPTNAPTQSDDCCNVCCIKGTGLKDIAVISSDLFEGGSNTPAFMTEAWTPIIEQRAYARPSSPRRHGSSCQSLLRMHCALII